MHSDSYQSRTPVVSSVISFKGDEHHEIKPWNIVLQNSRRHFNVGDYIKVRDERYRIISIEHDISVRDTFFDLNIERTYDNFVETIIMVEFVEPILN